MGEVVEVTLKSGKYAYCQNINNDPPFPLVRTMPGIFEAPLPKTEVAVLCADGTQFVAQFPLKVLLTNRHAKTIGVFEYPEELSTRPPIRHFAKVSDRNPDGWFIIDDRGRSFGGAEFAERFPGIDQSSLPVGTIPGIGLFLRMIEAAWTTRRAGHGSIGLDPDDVPQAVERPTPGDPSTTYTCLFRGHDDAQAAMLELRARGLRVRLDSTASGHWHWIVLATASGPFDVERDAWVEAVALSHGGVCEGSEFGPIGRQGS